MKTKLSNRQFLSVAIIFFYLLPLLFFAFYSIGLMSRHKSWSVLSLGLLITACGSLALILLLYYWEQTVREKLQQEKQFLTVNDMIRFSEEKKETKVTSLDSHLLIDHLPTSEASVMSPLQEELVEPLAKPDQIEGASHFEVQLKEKDLELKELYDKSLQLEQKASQIAQDFADYKIFSEEQLKQKNLQITNFQKTVEDQRSEMEKYQEQIGLLDTKVHDLSYEIKTLLYLNETEVSSKQSSPQLEDSSVKIAALHSEPQLSSYPPYGIAPAKTFNPDVTSCLTLENGQIQTAAEADALLKRCISIAQKLTGANYYGQEASRYCDFSSPYHTIDQRRLFDSLRTETGAIILVYSQKEQKLIFANNQSKAWLGWSPEKLIHDFTGVVQEGLTEWKKAMTQLTPDAYSHVRLLMKTKNGQELLLKCHLGAIANGLFRHCAISILYPA